jgi:hypothetical protein
MAIRKVFAPLASTAILAVIACAVPSLTFAAGAEKKAPEPKPRPDVSAKVYTNDDLGWQSATPAPVGEIQPGQTSGAIRVAGSSPAKSAPVAQRPPLADAQDPKWYAGQLARLEAQLAGVEDKESQLISFRASGTTQGTGLVLNAPCEGITTDNFIAQLGIQRQEISQQIDDLNDAASANGLSSQAIAEASAVESQLTAEQQRADLTARYQQLSAELAETEAVTADMHQQAAAQGFTLLPVAPGNGGNMTTNLLSRISAQSDSLQSETSNVEADALSLGVQPGDLR